MRKIWFVLCFLILANTAFSQVNSPPQTTSLSSPAQPASRGFDDGYDRSSGSFVNNLKARIARKTEPLYRKPNASELEYLKVEESLKDKHKQFLSQKDTSIFTLMPDLGCADDTRIVIATGVCQYLTLPGAGASYSFRKNIYRLKRLADISFSGDEFFSRGNMLRE